MAYSKTTWQNNVTDIDENNLNKIEQGIYDNSLVVDAVTNTLNPTDTETYKTAELTEGQITDVIGVSDIVIKGQTSQDGTPTPSSPVDVNVVSGDNTIDICGKNLFDGVFRQGNRYTTSLSDTTRLFTTQNYFVKQGQQYTLSTTLGSNYKYAINLSTIKFPIPANTQYFYDSGWKTRTFTFSPDQDGYLGIVVATTNGSDNLSSSSISSYTWQLEKSSTATTYESHQGKELTLDLPIENLFLEFSIADRTASGLEIKRNSDNTLLIKGTSTAVVNNWINNLNISLNSGTYTFSTNYDLSGKGTIVLKDNNSQNIAQFNSGESVTFSITETTVFNQMLIQVASGVTINNNFSFQLEQGSKANAYTPYGTDPIELCKIGDYQDYFYKSGSKWYLHKETLKIIIPSSVNGVMQNSNKRFFVNKTKLNNCDILHTSYGGQTYGLYCDILKEVTAGQTWSGIQGISYDYNETPGSGGLDFSINGLTTVAEYQEALEGKIIVARLNTPTNTEITDTTLISQLEAIYNAPLYEETNITQENNDLPMVLDITACKDNINGIKAFIRK